MILLFELDLDTKPMKLVGKRAAPKVGDNINIKPTLNGEVVPKSLLKRVRVTNIEETSAGTVYAVERY